MPHGHCYLWRSDILWTHVISDVVIGVSYYVIPIILGVLMFKRKAKLPHPEDFGLFMAFIFFCGTTHFVSIYVTWYPLYEYQGWVKALTAFISLLTVIVLTPKIPALINLSGLEAAYQANLAELEIAREDNFQMQNVYTASLHREEKIIELKKEVNELLIQQGGVAAYDV